MDRSQLNKIAHRRWPKLRDVQFWAPELLGQMMWDKVGDPETWVLYQLYDKSETFRRCLVTNTDWPSAPGTNYPGNYHADALRLMDMIDDKEAWQYSLCAHFRELL